MTKVYVDKARLLGRVIIISWVTLFLCFIVKIFGGDFFEIVAENENYKALCEYAETHLWLDFVLAMSSSLLCEFLYILAIAQRYKPKVWESVAVFVSCTFSWVADIYAPQLSIATNILMLFVLPVLSLGKNYKKYWHILVAFCLTFGFQAISLAVKGLALKPVDDSIFITLIYMIDVYIMCTLYYLYRNFAKEIKGMGRFWVLFAGTSTEKLLKMKAVREAKIQKYEEEKRAIEIELSKRKAEK